MSAQRVSLTAAEAEAAGYVSLTNPYDVVEEAEELERGWAQLRGCTVCLVDTRLGLAIWRHRREVKNERDRLCGEPARGRAEWDPVRPLAPRTEKEAAR